MNTFMHIVAIVMAFILAATRMAFSVIRQKDRAAGVFLSDSAYTISGTLRSMLQAPEKRREEEKKESFREHLAKHEKERRRIDLAVTVFVVTDLAAGGAILLRYGMTGLVFMNLTLAGMAVGYWVTRRSTTVVMIMVLTVVTGIIGVGCGVYIELAVLIWAASLTAVHCRERKSVGKNRGAN